MKDDIVPTTKLRILETTDLHMQLDGFDYLQDAPGRNDGLLGLVPLIDQARSEVATTLLCDNGDFLQGTPLADILINDPATHPMINAFNRLGYDAITLGNHEFNYGLTALRAVLKDSVAPVLCANLRTAPREYFCPPWTIIERKMPCSDQKTRPLKIGVIGLVTPRVTDWDCLDPDETLIADDIIDAARTQIPAMQRDGADIIVALCHAGIGSDTWTPKMENPALFLAGLDGIDVVLTGHTHDVFPSTDFAHIKQANIADGTVHQTPTVMAGHDASHLGVIDLTLEHKAGKWRVRDHAVSVRSAVSKGIGTDPLELSHPAFLAAHAKTRAHLAEGIAKITAPISTHFAAIGYDPTTVLNAKAKIAVITPKLAQGPFADLPLIASASCFHMGGRAGARNFIHNRGQAFTRRDVAAISPFNNPICAVLQRGWQLRAWLERGARYFNQVVQGRDRQPLVNRAVPSYHLDLLYGLSYRIDLTKPVHGGRVVDLAYNDAPILDDDLFVVATDSYKANGGAGMEVVPDHDIALQTNTGVATALAAYASAIGTIDPVLTPNWTFVPSRGTSVVFPSAQDASTRNAPVPLTRLTDDATGFSQIELRL